MGDKFISIMIWIFFILFIFMMIAGGILADAPDFFFVGILMVGAIIYHYYNNWKQN